MKPLLEGVRSFNKELIEGVSGTIGVTIGEKIDGSLKMAEEGVNLFTSSMGTATQFLNIFNTETIPALNDLFKGIDSGLLTKVGINPNKPTYTPVKARGLTFKIVKVRLSM